MGINSEEIFKRLGRALDAPLPGAAAHSLMDPMGPDKRRMSDSTNARESAVMILLSEQDHEIKWPLIQRPIYNGHHSGQIALPGGKWEESDVELQKTALRETHEEIGVSQESVKLIGSLSPIYVPPSNFNITPFVGIWKERLSYIPEPDEVQGIFETSTTEITDLALRKEKTIELSNNVVINVPCFDLPGGLVWGATAMILIEFAILIDRIKHE